MRHNRHTRSPLTAFLIGYIIGEIIFLPLTLLCIFLTPPHNHFR